MKSIKLIGLIFAFGLMSTSLTAQYNLSGFSNNSRLNTLTGCGKSNERANPFAGDVLRFRSASFMLEKNLFVKSEVALTSHGSLAIDSNQGSAYGFAYNYSTSAGADEKALSECGYNCQVVERFTNGCAAYAADQTSGSTVYGWGETSDAGSAQNRALNECQSRGGRRCVVRSWACNGN